MWKVALGASVLAAAINAVRPAETARLTAAAQALLDIRGAVPPYVATAIRCVAVAPMPNTAGTPGDAKARKGVLSCRSGEGWSAPVFVEVAGGPGVQSRADSPARAAGSDIVLLVMTRKGVQMLLDKPVTLGVDAPVAAGPVGSRGRAAETPSFTDAEFLAYSRRPGSIDAIDLTGAVLRSDPETNQEVYGSGASPRTILATRAISAPVEANGFLQALLLLSPNVTATPADAAAALIGTMPASAGTAGPAAAPGQLSGAPPAAAGIDADIRARALAMQQTLDRLLSEAAPSSVATTGAAQQAPANAGRVTVDRARLIQLRQQLDALIAALDRKQSG